MKQKCLKPTRSFASAEFRKKYQASPNYMHKKIADADVLISVGANIADFNGYIEINESAAMLWETLQIPCELERLEQMLEETYHISHEAAAADVFEFINLLIENEMVLVS